MSSAAKKKTPDEFTITSSSAFMTEWPKRFSLEKRAFVRVKYPDFGQVGGLPRPFLMGREMRVLNMSVGGLLIEAHPEISWDSMAKQLEIIFECPSSNKTIRQMTELLRVRQGRCHMRFMDVSPDLLVEFVIAARPGFNGQRLTKVANSGSLGARNLEKWTSLWGDSVEFYKITGMRQFAVDIVFNRRRFNLSADNQLTMTRDGHVVELSGGARELDELIVFLSNIPNGTAEMNLVIQRLSALN